LHIYSLREKSGKSKFDFHVLPKKISVLAALPRRGKNIFQLQRPQFIVYAPSIVSIDPLDNLSIA